jgi:hypothetical protein
MERFTLLCGLTELPSWNLSDGAGENCDNCQDSICAATIRSEHLPNTIYVLPLESAFSFFSRMKTFLTGSLFVDEGLVTSFCEPSCSNKKTFLFVPEGLVYQLSFEEDSLLWDSQF